MKNRLKNMKVSIIGAGRTGIATAEKVKQYGGFPFVSDSSANIPAETTMSFQNSGIEFETGGHSEKIFDCDLMILSPGIAANSEIVLNARKRGIDVWPEIELAYRLCEGRIIGITGSNGKTTTTALIGEIFANAELSAFVCGNIGFPFISVAGEVPADGYAVVELSSFQLEIIKEFHPFVATVLNITADHLDRHGDMSAYAGAKFRIFENQGKEDYSILNYDDRMLRSKGPEIHSNLKWFSVLSNKADIFIESGRLMVGDSELMKTDEIKLKGEHNLSNVCAAVGAAQSVGIDNDNLINTLKSFAGVEHRLEFVRLIGGISFINDSKGTNVDSVYWALKAVSAPVVLIAGGRDKGGDFERLNEQISEKVKSVILLGEAAKKIERAWGGITTCKFVLNMDEAVGTAYGMAEPGDTVLLSPGCASFDMFENYEHRGRRFKQAVLNLEKRGITR